MVTRSTQFMLVATLGILLSFAFVGTAMAEPPIQTSFTVVTSSNPCVAPCTVTVTDTTPEAADHQWDFHFDMANAGYHAGFQTEVTAGSPQCLTVDCSQAQWVYTSPAVCSPDTGCSPPQEMGYKIAEKASNVPSYIDHYVDVIAPADTPAEITMVSPSSVELPADIILASPKPNMTVGECYQGTPDTQFNWTPLPGTEFELCEPYFVRRTGPDSNGLYYYTWRLPISKPGQTVLHEVKAWSSDSHNADEGNFSFTVTGNRLKYGDFHSCTDGPVTKAVIAYYAPMSTEVVLKLEKQATRGKRSVWKVQKVRTEKFEVGPTSTVARYERRIARFSAPRQLRQKRTHKRSGSMFRATYLVKQGRKVIKRGRVSTKACQHVSFRPYVQP